MIIIGIQWPNVVFSIFNCQKQLTSTEKSPITFSCISLLQHVFIPNLPFTEEDHKIIIITLFQKRQSIYWPPATELPFDNLTDLHSYSITLASILQYNGCMWWHIIVFDFTVMCWCIRHIIMKLEYQWLLWRCGPTILSNGDYAAWSQASFIALHLVMNSPFIQE